MIAVAGVMLALTAARASAALFSFESTEAVPSQSFSYDESSGTLTGATTVPLTIQISGVNTPVASVLTFSATRVEVQSFSLPGGGPAIDIWVFDGSFQFTTPGGVLILSAEFTGGRTITMSGYPLSGIQDSSDGPGTLSYTAGPGFNAIAGNVLGFDPNLPGVLVEFNDPQSMGFTLTGVLPTGVPGDFGADSSFSGNAAVAITIVPEPASVAMIAMGVLMIVSRTSRRTPSAA